MPANWVRFAETEPDTFPMSEPTDTRHSTVTLRDGDLMVARDVSKALGLSAEMVAKLRWQGILPAIQTPSGRNIFLTKDVLALKAKREKTPRGNGKGQVAWPRKPKVAKK